jgi:hypothetical protein
MIFPGRHCRRGFEQRDGGRPRLSRELQPYPGGWRASKAYLRQTTAVLDDPGAALPHYPMVLHGGRVARRQLKPDAGESARPGPRRAVRCMMEP